MRKTLWVYGHSLPSRFKRDFSQADPSPTRLTIEGWRFFIDDMREKSGQSTHGGCRLFGKTSGGETIDLFAETALSEIEAL